MYLPKSFMLKNLYLNIYKFIPNKIKRIMLEQKIFCAFKNNRLQEYKKEIDYIKKNKISFFPYEFSKEYLTIEVEINKDESNNLYFVVHDGKKLYFPRTFSENEIVNMYRSLVIEQNNKCPHKYFDEKVYNLQLDSCIFVDCGAAEAIVSLEFIEKVKKVIIIESSEKWNEPLHATFDPWKEKVIFINKFVDEITTSSTISLDDLLKNEKGTLIIKMDIEGAEKNALEGAKKILESDKKIYLSVCTYHNKGDFEYISNWFTRRNIKNRGSKGYALWYFVTPLSYPYFRKCLIRAEK